MQELARITAAPESKLESYKRFKPVMSADFDENYQPITGNYPAVTPGSYTVRGGDTLRSVAQAVWGDAALWYVLADANGLSADEALKPNTTLVIPNKVTNIHNTAQTFKPYQAGQGVGDASPTMLDPPPPPQPKGGGGCGGIASVIAVVIAVVVVAVVTVYTSGTGTAPTMQALGGAGAGVTGSGAAAGGAVAGAAASAPLSLGASIGYGAAAGAAASALSQGVMILAGEQHGFNWKGVALGAVGGAISGGLAGAGVGSSLNPIGAGMVRGAIGSAATQGVALASGMQQRFDWRGVAASAIAGGIGAGIGEAAGAAKWSPLARQVSSGLGAGLASAGVRGDLSARSLGYIAADLVGNTIGNQVAERLVEGMGREGGVGNALGASLASGNSSVTSSSGEAALAQAGGGYNSDAAYNQLVDAFSQPGSSYGDTSLSSPWQASNDLTGPGLPKVMSDAGYGGYDGHDARVAQLQAMAGQALSEGDTYELNGAPFNVEITGVGKAGGVGSTADVHAYAVPYQNVVGTALPEFGDRVAAQSGGNAGQDFLRGWSGGYMGVMEGANPSTALMAGKYLGDVWDSTKQAVYDMTGASAFNAARVSLAAGDYLGAASWGAKSFSDAGMAVLGFGMGAMRPVEGVIAAAPRMATAPELVEGSYSLLGANRAVIDPRKLTEYALNPEHPVGGNKARVFESAMGFTQSNADDLLQQLRQGVMGNTPIPGKIDQFGSRFTVDIPVTGPTGSGTVRSGWIYKPGSNVPELTTIFVK